jgi:hypothetical protein
MVDTDRKPYGYLSNLFDGAQKTIPELVARVATANGSTPSCSGDPVEIIDELRERGVSPHSIGVGVRAHVGVIYRKNGPKAWRVEQAVTELLLPENNRGRRPVHRRSERQLR